MWYGRLGGVRVFSIGIGREVSGADIESFRASHDACPIVGVDRIADS